MTKQNKRQYLSETERPAGADSRSRRGSAAPGSSVRTLAEKEVIAFIMNHFALNDNVRIFRRNTGAVKTDKRFIRYGKPGMSDLFGWVKLVTCPKCGKVTGYGVHLEIEVKRAGGKVSPAQKEWLQEARRGRAIAVVAEPKPTPNDPTGFNGLKTFLNDLDKRLCSLCSKESNGNRPAKDGEETSR